MAQQKKTELVSQLKKSYSTISNGLKRAMAQDGVSKLEDTTLFSKAPAWGENNPEFLAEFSKIFQVSRAYAQGEIMRQEPHEDLVSYTYLNNSGPNRPSNAESSVVILNDGSILYPQFNTDGTGNVIVDVNGAKKPNQWGRDVFTFIVHNNGNVVPYGIGEADFRWDTSPYGQILCTPGNAGEGCAGRIMEQGWEMKY